MSAPPVHANHSNTLAELMQSKYGNYVVQRAFEMSDSDRRDILLKKIEYVVQEGKANPRRAHAKHIFTFLETKFNVKFSFSNAELAEESSQPYRHSNPTKKKKGNRKPKSTKSSQV